MNAEQAAEYTERLNLLSKRHEAILTEYVEPPFGERTLRASQVNVTVSAPGIAPRSSVTSLEAELIVVQEELANTPPLCQTESGLWIPTAKGLSHGPRKTADPLVWRVMDDSEIIPVDQWAKWLENSQEPPTVQPFCKFMFYQGQVGSCAAESANAAIEVCEVFAGQEPTLFNPYATYHYTSGGSDSGSTLEDNIASLQTRGAFPESVWPRSKGWRATPSAEALVEAKKHRLLELVSVRNKAEMGSQFLKRKAVYYWYDFHAVLAVALLSLTQFLYRNSWSKDWGNAGYGTMAFGGMSYSGFYAFGSSTSN